MSYVLAAVNGHPRPEGNRKLRQRDKAMFECVITLSYIMGHGPETRTMRQFSNPRDIRHWGACLGQLLRARGADAQIAYNFKAAAFNGALNFQISRADAQYSKVTRRAGSLGRSSSRRVILRTGENASCMGRRFFINSGQ